ncbi:isochorismatase [Aidingimonas lacisalsi]|uniref:isochorismatase n=1 Tax=Aidingimonas lacisalsi TaxID=2604086 RepID=UPI0011D2BB1A|nr:isochorismatase [Aidingimonas lacisalsi]
MQSVNLGFAGSYATRPIRFLELAIIDGWRVKTYGISAQGDTPNATLVQTARELASKALPTPPVQLNGSAGSDDGNEPFDSLDRYGVAVMIVHEAREGCFVLLDWWTGENMLQHHVYFSRDTTNPEFADVSQTGIGACVWELKVLSFEREAWIDCVLASEEGADLDGYCSRHFSADV